MYITLLVVLVTRCFFALQPYYAQPSPYLFVPNSAITSDSDSPSSNSILLYVQMLNPVPLPPLSGSGCGENEGSVSLCFERVHDRAAVEGNAANTLVLQV